MSKARAQRAPYGNSQWKRCIKDGSCSLENFADMLQSCSEKGLDNDAKKELWPYLLGVFRHDSTPEQRQQQMQEMNTAWQGLLQACQEKEAQILHIIEPQAASSNDLSEGSQAGSPVAPDGDLVAARSSASFTIRHDEALPVDLMQFREAQRIIVMDAIRTDFKKNTLTKVEALTSWFSSAIADSSLYQRLNARDEGWAGGGWLSRLARHQLAHASHFSVDQKRQVVRLVSLVSAYSVHDPQTGYCQGMSDLALPFLLVLEDDALAFWCFEALMRKVRRNFAIEESGIFAQLATLAALLERLDAPLFLKLRQVGATDCHFAYRMVVVLMRRELPLDQALRLHEMMWADDLLHILGLEGPGALASSPALATAASTPLPSLQTAQSVPVESEPSIFNFKSFRMASAMSRLASPLARYTAASGRTSVDMGVGDDGAEVAERGEADLPSPSGVSVPCTPCSSMRMNSTSQQTPGNTPSMPLGVTVPGPMAPLCTPIMSPVTRDDLWLPQSPSGAAMVASLQAAVPMVPSTHVRSNSVGSAAALAAFSHLSLSQMLPDISHTVIDENTDSKVSETSSTAAAAATTASELGTSSDDEDEPQMGLLLYFVAAVIIAQRRRVLDDCTDSGDVMRAFQQVPSLGIDVSDCMRRARVYRERERRAATLRALAGPAAAPGVQGPDTPAQPPPDRELRVSGSSGSDAAAAHGEQQRSPGSSEDAHAGSSTTERDSGQTGSGTVQEEAVGKA